MLLLLMVNGLFISFQVMICCCWGWGNDCLVFNLEFELVGLVVVCDCNVDYFGVDLFLGICFVVYFCVVCVGFFVDYDLDVYCFFLGWCFDCNWWIDGQFIGFELNV